MFETTYLSSTIIIKCFKYPQKHEKPKVVICFCFTENGDVVSGDSNGNIYLWERGTLILVYMSWHDAKAATSTPQQEAYLFNNIMFVSRFMLQCLS